MAAATASVRHSPLLVRNVPEGTEEEDLEEVFKQHGWEVRRRPDGTGDVVITGNRAVVTLADASSLAGVLSKSGTVDLGANQLAFSTANNTPQKVVNHVRATWGVGANLTPADQTALNNLKKTIGETLKPLSEDSAALAMSFLLELLQNADDNEYRVGTTPSVDILMRENPSKTENHLYFVNNEAGFHEANVYAVCGVGLTTKTHHGGYIGEKNLHFKTVFAVSSSPMIISNQYQFQFKQVPSDNLSYIVPHWVASPPAQVRSGSTNIVLPLKAKVVQQVLANLKKVEVPILLFLRKLRLVKIDLNDGNPITLQRMDAPTGRVHLMHQTKNAKTTMSYTVIEQDYSIPLNMKQARNCPSASVTRLTLAFPHEGAESQQLYAFLPVADFGFRFMIQGDFEFPGARNELASTPWNLWLRGAIPTLFTKAVARLQNEEDFASNFYQFVPLKSEVTAPFFKTVVDNILEALKKAECVLTTDGRWMTPDTVFFPPTGILSELVAQGDIIDASGKAFLSPKIDVENAKVKEVLVALGVQEFNMTNFLGFLTNKKFLEGKPTDFLSRLYGLMSQLITEGTLKPEALQPVPLIMLQTGALVAPETSPMYMPPGGYNATHDFEAMVPMIHAAFIGDENAVALFQQLGLKEASPESIILEYIIPNMQTMPTEDVILATQYVKECTEPAMQESLRTKGFMLVTADGKLVKATELILPSPYNPYPVQEIFGATMQFVTTAYVPAPPLVPKPPSEEVWASWRRFLMRLGANLLFQIVRTPTGGYTSPNAQRVLEPGPFTRMQQLQLRAQLCVAISKLWEFIEPFTKTPKEPVTLFWRSVQMARWLPGSDGRLHRPCDQFLYQRTKAIESIMKGTVVYLQAEVTSEVAKALGVKTEVPPELLVDKLAGTICTSEVYSDIYSSLEVNWSRCSIKVKTQLMNTKIIRVSGKLYTAKELVWVDESGVLTKIPSLKGHYPALQKFFVEYLGVPLTPSLQHYLAELDIIKGPAVTAAKEAVVEIPDDLTPEMVERVRRLYYGMAQALLAHPDSNITLLTTKPVFLSHRGDWVMHDVLLINDQPQRFAGLGDQPDIHFWDIPVECIPKIQAVMRAVNIPSLTTLKPIGGAPDPKAITRSEYLTKQVRSLVPYLLRYVFYRHHTHYTMLKKPWKYFATQVWTAKSLPATYQFNNVQWSAELPWFVKDDAEEAHILVGGDPERTLPRALAECFGASPLTIMGMLAAKTPGNLNTMLVDMGVGDMPPAELPPEMRPEVAELASEKVGSKRPIAEDVDAGPPAKRACPPNEAPLKLIPAITPDTLKEIEPSTRDEIPQMNTTEARNQMRPWGQQYLGLVLLQNGMKDIQCTVAGPDAPPYDITYISHGWVHYGLIHCTLEARMPTLSMTPKQWQCALQYGNRYHIFIIRSACTNQACVSQLTDPAALVASGKWPCQVTFSAQA
eukprot:GGOE01003734.1.p1 GENE.GGOE01003734.1~~GGOE01003734.1.p1  ORF type:complete len:1439 (-),score=488.44 GGOE01003734.1:246-4562(-)